MINSAINWLWVHDEVGTSIMLVPTILQAGGDMSLLSYTVPTLLAFTVHVAIICGKVSTSVLSTRYEPPPTVR